MLILQKDAGVLRTGGRGCQLRRPTVSRKLPLAAMAVLGQVKGNGVAVLPEGYSAADPAQDPKAAARLLSPPVTDVRKPQKERHGGADEKED